MFLLGMNHKEELLYIQKLNKELAKDDEISKTRNKLLLNLWWKSFWKSFIYNISQWKISDENIKTITNHKDEVDKLLLLKEFCKIEWFTDFIKHKVQNIQSAITKNSNASWVFDQKHIKISLENILSINQSKKDKDQQEMGKYKVQIAKKTKAKYNGNQKSMKKNKAN